MPKEIVSSSQKEPKAKRKNREIVASTDASSLSSASTTELRPDLSRVGEYQLDSQYDSGLKIDSNQESHRALMQGFGSELANGITSGLVNIIPTVIGNVGSILDFEDYYSKDEEVGNWLTEAMEEFKKSNVLGTGTEQLPVYGGNEVGDYGNREWWVKNGSDLVTSAGGFVFTGGALGKGVSFLSGLAKTAKIAGAIEGAGGVVSAIALNQAESIPSAMNIYDTVYKLQLQKGESDDKAKQIAADAAAYSVNINRINIPLNLTSAFAFLRSSSQLSKTYKNLTLRNALLTGSVEGLQETGEEAINFISEQEALRKGKEGENYEYNFNNTINDLNSPEGIQSMLLGFLGGKVQTLGTYGVGELNGNNKIAREQFKLQQETLKSQAAYGKIENLQNIQEVLDSFGTQADYWNKIQEASVTGDTETVNILKDNMLAEQALQAFKSGTMDNLINTYKSIQNDPNLQESLGPEYTTKTQEAIGKIKDWGKLYSKIERRVHPEVVGDVFKNRIGQKFTEELIYKKRGELANFTVKKSSNDINGVVNSELDEEIARTSSELEILENQNRDIDAQYQELIQPDYIEKKKAAEEAEIKRVEEEAKQVEDQERKDLAGEAEIVEDLPIEVGTEVEIPEGNGIVENITEDGIATVNINGQLVEKDVTTLRPQNVKQIGSSSNSPTVDTLEGYDKTSGRLSKVNGLATKTFETQEIEINGKKVKVEEKDENGNLVSTKASLNLSSPTFINKGDKLIYFVDTAYAKPQGGYQEGDVNTIPIAVAFADKQDEIIGYVHTPEWVDNGTAPSDRARVKAEVMAIRNAVLASDTPVEGYVKNKTYNVNALIIDRRNNYSHTLSDSYGGQSANPKTPNKFGESFIVKTNESNIPYEGQNKIVTGAFGNNTAPNSVYVAVPSPIMGEKVYTKVMVQTLGQLGQVKVISTLVNDYLTKGGDLDILIDKVHNIDEISVDNSEAGKKTFKLSNIDGKLRIEFGNSTFTEGVEDFNIKEFENFLDKKPLNVVANRLDSVESFQTYKIGVKGEVVADRKFSNYASYLDNSVLKSNVTGRSTTDGEKVFFAQPVIELGLGIEEIKPKKRKGKKSIPVEDEEPYIDQPVEEFVETEATIDVSNVLPDVKIESWENKLENALTDNDTKAALSAISESEGKYAGLAKLLSGEIGSVKVTTQSNLKLTLPNGKQIKVRGKFEDGAILVDDQLTGDKLHEAIIHEAIHSITVDKIKSYLKGELKKLTEKEITAIKALDRLRQNSKGVIKKKLSDVESYGLETLPEFVALLSNPEFQEFLNGIPHTKGSLLDRVIEVLSKLIGFDVKEGSVLEQSLKEAVNLIESKKGKVKKENESFAFPEFADNKKIDKEETYEKVSTGDKATDDYIDALNNRVRNLQDKRTDNNKVFINQEIWNIKKEIGFLYSEHSNLFKVLRGNKSRTEDLLKKKDITWDDLILAHNNIGMWSVANDVIQVVEGSKKAATKEEISGKYNTLRNDWVKRAKELTLKEAKKKNQKLTGKDLESGKDSSKIAAQALSSGVSPNALEAYTKQLIDEVQFQITEEANRERETNKKEIDKLGGKKNHIKILQKDSNGNITGNLLDEHTSEYQQKWEDLENKTVEVTIKDKKSKVRGKDTIKGLKWIRENHKLISITEQKKSPEGQALLNKYEEEREFFLKSQEALRSRQFKDKDTDPTSLSKYKETLDKDIKKWENQNSPYKREEMERNVLSGEVKESKLYSMQGDRFFLPPVVTNDKFFDKNYTTLSQTEKDFIKFFKKQFTKYLPYLSVHGSVRNNTIPSMKAGLMENFKKDGLGIFKGLGDKMLDNVTVSGDDVVEYGNLDAELMPERRLKTRMIGNNLKPNEKSYDLEYVLNAWVEQAAGIKYKSQVESQILVAEKLAQMLKKEKPTYDGDTKKNWNETDAITGESLANINDRFSYMVDVFYDMRKAVEITSSGKIKGDKRISSAKSVDAIIKLTQASALALNVTAGGANWMLGTLSNYMYAAGDREFGTKNFFKSIALNRKALTNKNTKSKIAAIMAKYQIVSDPNHVNYGGKSSLDGLYFLLRWGEYKIQAQVMIAMMDKIKMEDGKTSLFDALDQNGNVKPEFANSKYADVISEGETKSSPEVIKLSGKIRETIAKTQGDYDPRNAKLMKKYSIGRLLSQFRGFIPRAYQTRLGASREDFYSDEESQIKGRYRSLNSVEAWKNLLAYSLLGKSLGMNATSISVEDDANIKVTLREMTLAASFYVATLILQLAVEDDEENKAVYQYFLNTFGRLEADLSFWASPTQMLEMVQNPAAALRTADNLVKTIDAFQTMEGNKIGTHLIKIVPVVNQGKKLYDLGTRNFYSNWGTKILEDEE